MIERVINLIKGVFNNMVQKNTVESTFKIDIALSGRMREAINKWAKMYENKASWLNEDVKSLDLPSTIASEFTRLMLTEANITITGSPRADYISEQFKGVSKELFDKVEKGNAVGGLVLKPYVKRDKIYVDFIKSDSCFPVTFDDTGKITGIVFVSQKTEGYYIYTRLEYQRLIGTNFIVTNKAFKSKTSESLGKEIPLNQVEEWKNIEEETTIENIERPLFSYYKPPSANNVDSKSPLGISVYSKSANLIKDADEQYGRVMWEYEGSEKAIYASLEALKPTKEIIRDGNKKRTIWTPPKLKERLFKAINIQDKNDSDLFKDYSPEIRDENFWRGLNKILERIEFNSGLAYGTLSEPAFSDKTATEIKSSKQRSYVTISRAQENLGVALDDLVYAIDILITLYNLAPLGNYELACQWGDSVLTDTQAEQAIANVEVGNGTRSKKSYMRNIRKMSDEEIEKELQEMQEEKQSNVEMFGFGNIQDKKDAENNKEKSKEKNKKGE